MKVQFLIIFVKVHNGEIVYYLESSVINNYCKCTFCYLLFFITAYVITYLVTSRLLLMAGIFYNLPEGTTPSNLVYTFIINIQRALVLRTKTSTNTTFNLRFCACSKKKDNLGKLHFTQFFFCQKVSSFIYTEGG